MSITGVILSKDFLYMLDVGSETGVFNALGHNIGKTSLNEKYRKVTTFLKVDLTNEKQLNSLAQNLRSLRNGFSNETSLSLRSCFQEFLENTKDDQHFLDSMNIIELTFSDEVKGQDKKIIGFIYRYIQVDKK